jgi:hypothetical protein
MIKGLNFVRHVVAKILGLFDWVQSGPFANEGPPVSLRLLCVTPTPLVKGQ